MDSVNDCVTYHSTCRDSVHGTTRTYGKPVGSISTIITSLPVLKTCHMMLPFLFLTIMAHSTLMNCITLYMPFLRPDYPASSSVPWVSPPCNLYDHIKASASASIPTEHQWRYQLKSNNSVLLFMSFSVPQHVIQRTAQP